MVRYLAKKRRKSAAIWSYGEAKRAEISLKRGRISEDDKKKLKTYFERFDAHFESKANPVFSRYKLHNPSSRRSGDDETVGNWLKTTGQGLCFQGTNEKIRDRIWLVQILTKLEEKLINVVKDLSLVKDIEIPRTYELSKAQ